MITGVRKKELTPESVLNLISEFDIYRMYMPDKDWKINQATTSPFRVDHNPSFSISNRNGQLHHIDFADSNYRGDCFEFVKQMFHMNSLDDVLRKIDQDFGLNFYSNSNPGEYKRIVKEYIQPEELGKRYSLIQVKTRKFTNDELLYWSEYYQDINDLRANNIYSIKELYLNRQRIMLEENELRFGYFYPSGGWWKIYKPHSERKYKWISNVPLVTTYGLENLQRDKNTLICKSLKDMLVCKKVYENVCHIQNESLAALSEETVSYLKKNSKEVFYSGDSDVPGKSASYAITKAFGFRHINPPDRLLPQGKDWGDWVKLEGLEPIKEHFINKKLICT